MAAVGSADQNEFNALFKKFIMGPTPQKDVGVAFDQKQKPVIFSNPAFKDIMITLHK